MITVATSNIVPSTAPSVPPPAAVTQGSQFSALIGFMLNEQGADQSADLAAKPQPATDTTPAPDQGAPGSWLHFVLPFGAPTKVTKANLNANSTSDPTTPPATPSIVLPSPALPQPALPMPIAVALTPGVSQPHITLPAQQSLTSMTPAMSPTVAMPSNNNLAFAAKLTEVAPAIPTKELGKPLPLSPTPSTAATSVIDSDSDTVVAALSPQKAGQNKPDSGKGDSDNLHEDPSTQSIQQAMPPAGTQQIASFAASLAPAETTKTIIATAPKAPDSTPVAAQLIPEPSAAGKSQPVRDLSFQIGTGTGSQVDVRIQDRAGEVRVAVHTSNPELTTDMRQQLGDLVVRLDRAGYHSETYKPASETQSAQSSSESSDNSPNDSPGDRQQQQEQPQGRQRKDTRPQWLQEMNGNPGSAPSQGARN